LVTPHPTENGAIRRGRTVSNITCCAELKIPSDTIYLRPVRAFIRELAENSGFHHKKAIDIEIAVDEIFSNAIEHGSAGFGSQVAICCFTSDEIMEVIITDSGRGQNSEGKWIDSWSDTAIKEEFHPETERGHGLLLAHNLTDEMNIETNSTGGVDVHLVIYKGGR